MPIKSAIAPLALLLAGYGLGQWFPIQTPAPASHSLSPPAGGASRTADSSKNGQVAQAGTLSAERRATLISSLLRASEHDHVLQNQRELSALLGEIGLADIPHAVHVVHQLKGRRSAALQKLVARWAELDPPAAAEFALTAEVSQRWERAALVQAATTEWVRRHPQAAQAWVAGLKDLAILRVAGAAVAACLAETDPPAALAWFKTLPANMRFADTYAEIFQTWGAHDPEPAVRHALTMPPGTIRARAVTAALEQWSYRNPAAAVAWAQALPEAGRRNEFIRDIFTVWGERDPAAAASAATALPAGTLRHFAISKVLTNLAMKDLPMTLKLAEELPNGALRMDAMARIGAALAQEEPRKGLELLTAQPPSVRRDAYMRTVIGYWLDRAPEEAADYLEQNYPPGEQRLETIRHAIGSWANTQPEAALGWMVKHSYTSASELERPVAAWAMQDPAQAMAWVQAVATGETRVKLENTVISSQAAHDVQAAMVAYEKLPPEQRLKDTAGAIAENLANQNPETAMRWASQLKDEAAQGAAYACLATSWTALDTTQVTSWIEKLPPCGNRDLAVSAFSKAAAEADPSAAAAWAETISEPTMRIVSLRHVFQMWKDRDETGAAQWLDKTSALDAAAKAAWAR